MATAAEIAARYSPARQHIILGIVVRNRLQEGLVIEEARITKPHGTFVSRGTADKPEPSLRVDQSVGALGTLGDVAGWPEAPNVAYVPLLVTLPAHWRGNAVEIELWISSNAATIRHKRIVRKVFVPAIASSTND